MISIKAPQRAASAALAVVLTAATLAAFSTSRPGTAEPPWRAAAAAPTLVWARPLPPAAGPPAATPERLRPPVATVSRPPGRADAAPPAPGQPSSVRPATLRPSTPPDAPADTLRAQPPAPAAPAVATAPDADATGPTARSPDGQARAPSVAPGVAPGVAPAAPAAASAPLRLDGEVLRQALRASKSPVRQMAEAGSTPLPTGPAGADERRAEAVARTVKPDCLPPGGTYGLLTPLVAAYKMATDTCRNR